MARQVINIGTNYNDGTGDKLRDAMDKINDNFIELYTDSTEGTNLNFLPNAIEAVNSNGNIKLDPNGIGRVEVTSGAVFNTENQPNSLFVVYDSTGNAALTIDPQYRNIGINGTENSQGLTVVGNANVSGTTANISANVLLGNTDKYVQFVGRINSSITPFASDVFDIGTSSLRFKDIYASNVTAVIGNLTTVNSSQVNTANIAVTTETVVGNLVIRDNEISNNILNEDIEIKPFGTGKMFVNTKVIIGSGATPMVNPYLQITGADNNFTQVGVQNINSGKFACSDSVVFNDQGSDFFNFVCMGHNNSGWDGSLQYIYFLIGSNAAAWTVGQTVYQIDPADGSSILAQGVIDEKVTNPLNAGEVRIRISQIYTGTTGLFEQGSVAGVVYNSTAGNSAMPQEHLVETITSNGNVTYNLGTSGTLNASTARAVFAPTVIMATDSLEVKVNGITQARGVDWTVEFNRIRFYTVPTVGATITLRQYPEANYPFTIGTEADAYFYNNGNKLTLGTMTGHDLVFHTNGTRYTAEAGRISGVTRNWIFGGHANDTGGQPDTGEKVQVKGDLAVTGEIVQTNRTISSSVGSVGDKAGMIASDNSYFYRCTANYDGSTAIWKRVPLNSW